jgi:hypothetical protein
MARMEWFETIDRAAGLSKKNVAGINKQEDWSVQPSGLLSAI